MYSAVFFIKAVFKSCDMEEITLLVINQNQGKLPLALPRQSISLPVLFEYHTRHATTDFSSNKSQFCDP